MAFHTGHVSAQSSISGDSVCGQWDPVNKKIINPCGAAGIQKIAHGIFALIIGVGLPLLIVFIIYRFIMAWYSLQQGNTTAYKDALQKATQAIIGFLIIVGLAGGIFLTLLRYIGVQETFLNLLKSISVEVIPRAYAAGSVCAPPKKGDTCYFNAKGTKLVGTITDADSMFDKSLFCKDDLTGLTSNTDFVNNTKYWRGTLDCTGKTNGTVCDQGPASYNSMGICSSSYTPPDSHFTSGPTDCIGKLPDTFCLPTGFTFGVKGGTCVRRTSTPGEATCYPVSTGEKCLSSFNEGKVGTADFNGSACIVVGDPCKLSNGKDGKYVQKQLGIFCVDPAIDFQTTVCNNTNIGQDCALPDSSKGKCSMVLINNSQTYQCAPKLVAGTNGITGPKYQNQIIPTPTPTPTVPSQPTELPNPIPGVNSLYDFILTILSMAMKFFLYPALVGIWVLSGFMYVFAQGAPEKLSKAHKLLMWAFISTLVIFTAQAFLSAVRNSVNKIVPATSSVITKQPTIAITPVVLQNEN
jgi:hypothetical protein